MRKEVRWLLFLVAMLAIGSLACDTLLGGAEDAPAVQEDAPGEEPLQESEPVAEGPQTLDLAGIATGLADVNSYRVEVLLEVEGVAPDGQPQPVRVTMSSAAVVEPPSSRTTVRFEGVEEFSDFGALEFLQVGDTTYSTVPGLGCVSGDAGGLGLPANPFDELFTSGDLVGDIQNAERVLPDETINGVETYHFRFDESAIQDPENTLEDVEGHVYIAKEGGYLVRMVMDGRRSGLDLFGTQQTDDGTLRLELNTFDVNAPVEITPPENCDTFDIEIPDFATDASASPYPVFAGARELFVVDNVVSYQVEATLDEVVSFYQEQLPAAGFTLTGSESAVTDSLAVVEFTLDDQAFVVTVSENNGVIDVFIGPG